MTTTLGLLTCCVIGNIVASPDPTYTAEVKSFIGPDVPKCGDRAGKAKRFFRRAPRLRSPFPRGTLQPISSATHIDRFAVSSDSCMRRFVRVVSVARDSLV